MLKVQRLLVIFWAMLLVPCGTGLAQQTSLTKTYVPYGGTFTPQGRLDVLVVYAGFTNDMNPASPIYDHKDWPAEQDFPNYANEIFYPDSSYFSLEATDKSLSNYYYQMSKHSADPLRIVGHRLPKRINVAATNEGNRKGWRYYFQEVYKELQKLDGIDWKQFDKRSNQPNFKYDNAHKGGPDSQIDFVIVVFRYDGSHLPFGTTRQFRNKWGLSTLFSKGQLKMPNDEILKITTGFSIAKGIDGPGGIRGFFLHENSHELYRMPHVYGTNSAMGNKFYTTNGWGMMGINKLFNCANSWERFMLGWIDIKHDLKSTPEENGVYELQDYLTSGDAIRIEMPHTEGMQHLWIENHQGVSVFDDRDAWNGKGSPPPPRGIMMYVECLPSSRNIVPRVFDYNQVNGFRALSATGNYDYIQSDTFRTPWEVGGNPSFDFSENRENPISGYSDVHEIRLDYKGTDLRNPSDRVAKPDGEITTRYSHGNELGCTVCKSENALNAVHDGKLNFSFLGTDIGFSKGDEINLSSNPMLTNTPTYQIKADSLTPYYLNQISIKVLERKPDGTMVLDIRFDANEVVQNVRYCGNLVLKENPLLSAEPELLVKKGVLLEIDKSGTPNQSKAGSEGDFVKPTVFTLEDGAEIKLEKGSKMLVENGSTLFLKNGSVLTIGRKARLVIDGSAFLAGEKGAQIHLKKGGKLKVRGKKDSVIEVVKK